MNSSKNIIFRSSNNDVKLSAYNNNTILFNTELTDINIKNVLHASTSIPLLFKPIKCILKDVGNKELIDFDLDKYLFNSEIEIDLYDGGISTDFSTSTIFSDILQEKITVDTLYIFDVENYYSLFDKNTTNKSSGITGIVNSLINAYDKYVKYNDLLQLLGYFSEKVSS